MRRRRSKEALVAEAGRSVKGRAPTAGKGNSGPLWRTTCAVQSCVVPAAESPAPAKVVPAGELSEQRRETVPPENSVVPAGKGLVMLAGLALESQSSWSRYCDGRRTGRPTTPHAPTVVRFHALLGDSKRLDHFQVHVSVVKDGLP